MFECRKIKGYKHYFISNDGNIFSVVKGSLTKLKNQISGNGYYSLRLMKYSGNCITEPIHRLVAKSFLKKEEGKNYVNHKDGNKLNNNVDNLEWCTHAENVKHAYDIGIHKPLKRPGSENPFSKLNESNVFEIKQRIAIGESMTKIANDFGVSKSTISSIKLGRSWGHVVVSDEDKVNYLYTIVIKSYKESDIKYLIEKLSVYVMDNTK